MAETDSKLALDAEITKDDLVSALKRLGLESSADGTQMVANQIMETIDTDKSGVIDWNEIREVFGDVVNSPEPTPRSRADQEKSATFLRKVSTVPAP